MKSFDVLSPDILRDSSFLPEETNVYKLYREKLRSKKECGLSQFQWSIRLPDCEIEKLKKVVSKTRLLPWSDFA